MSRVIAGKLALALITLAFVLAFNFFLFRAIGDPKEDLLRVPRMTAVQRAHLIEGSTVRSSTSTGSTSATRSAVSSRSATTRTVPSPT